MIFWRLVDTIVTEPVHMINNPDMVYVLRIEIYRQQEGILYSAKAWRYFHCAVQVFSPVEMERAIEEMISGEESMGIDEIRAHSEAEIMTKVFDKLKCAYELS